MIDTVTWRQCNDGAFRSAACDSLDTVRPEKSLKGKKKGKSGVMCSDVPCFRNVNS